MAAMASLVQDVWLGWEPRLRGRRLAPWGEPRVRLLFHLDAGSTLDDAAWIDLAYSPPFGGSWDPIHIAAQALRRRI